MKKIFKKLYYSRAFQENCIQYNKKHFYILFQKFSFLIFMRVLYIFNIFHRMRKSFPMQFPSN